MSLPWEEDRWEVADPPGGADPPTLDHPEVAGGLEEDHPEVAGGLEEGHPTQDHQGAVGSRSQGRSDHRRDRRVDHRIQEVVEAGPRDCISEAIGSPRTTPSSRC